MSLRPVGSLALLHSVRNRGYKRAREGTGPQVSDCECVWRFNPPPLRGTPLLLYSLGKRRGRIQKWSKDKKEKAAESDVIQPTLPQLSIVVGPAVLADGDGDHFSPIPHPVAIVADGKWHGALWMTPRWWCCCSQGIAVRSWPPSGRSSYHWCWLPGEVVVHYLINEALSYPCPISFCTEAWAIGHVYPCGSRFDRWWSPYYRVGRPPRGGARPPRKGRARRSPPAGVGWNGALPRRLAEVETAIGGLLCLELSRIVVGRSWLSPPGLRLALCCAASV